MEALFNFFPKSILLLIIVVIIGYYYAFWRYNNYLNNKKDVKNFNDNSINVKNNHIFDTEIESVPLFNRKSVAPSEDNTNKKNWKNILEEINNQGEEIETNNFIDEYLRDQNIDSKE
jgi:hypothetical protein